MRARRSAGPSAGVLTAVVGGPAASVTGGVHRSGPPLAATQGDRRVTST
ncbi:hypothetical protein Ae168Ps1_1189c [Pseudonocardia sp. Ae168_Ps1]|nr:hypothetical protein Ae150APs1_1186c [Pseudonocardia sp. Ae150A_Ps1]OLL78783.1 hypothetical protein Ae168Ps1_1189c [Pseudonocardia sp. Ae168_Ps1]OLL87091.1 hypothetical protein Ae263Ps1_4146 [Pseudonocardia sp. Ae263_Ps1]OLL92878.1 hypothetical protein Ae356Ps1_2775c [Pseudonocardia sp. Ae356_Ps1]